MDAVTVRREVRRFREETGSIASEEHCFPPWYLNNEFGISKIQALRQSSDGNYDFGIDAFHFALGSNGSQPSTLILVQAKYTLSIQQISNGFRGLEKALEEVRRGLKAIGTEVPIQNKVLVNLRAALNRMDAETRGRLGLDFRVLHLSEEDEAILGVKLRDAINRLSEAVADKLEEHTCRIRQVGPRDLGPATVVVAPPEAVALQIEGMHEFSTDEGARMFSGFARLADLVDLYRARRDDLFSRNVRYYLQEKKNTEKGPAGKMRATLKQMCVEDNLKPERFALFHNGITMLSRRAERTDGGLRLRDPYVLNGCQTIKNAFLFKEDGNLKSKIKDNCWQRVAVPIRVIETNDDELVRSVTVHNNRQNAMSASALRSNDPIQIRLEQRFKRSHIFYQRQEGKFANVWAMQPELFEDEYENTRRALVDINKIARAIAAAGGEIRLALRPNDLFESDAAYERCFNENTRLRSIVFLTFLQNLYDTIPIVLKKDLDLRPKVEGGPKPSYFLFHALCLLVRFLAREKRHDFVSNWGAQLHFRDKDFREEIRKIFNANSSGIRREIARRFMCLGSTEATGVNAAFEECKRALGLKDGIKPFDVFAKLDEEDNEEFAD